MSYIPTSPNDRLTLLLHLTQAFNSSLDLDEVLNRVMDEVITTVHAERGFVMLLDEHGKLDFRIARGMDQRTIETPAFEISRSTVERVASAGQPILTSDAQTDSRFSMRQSVMILGLRSVMCAPLKVKDQVTGVLYVDNRLQAGIFSQADLELLSVIAASAAIAIENARLYQVAIEKVRMEKELQLARRMQASLLPQQVPQVPGWEFAAYWLPAREVAGDFYDFIGVETPAGKSNQLGLVIADVTDKGMAAALFMALSRTILRASLGGDNLPEGFQRANRLICNEAANGFFVTLVYAQVNLNTGEVNYVNAGHNPPMVCSCNPHNPVKIGQLFRTAIPLGIEPDTTFLAEKLNLQPDCLLLLYTDGAVDALNPAEEHFGLDRLQAVLVNHRHESATAILTAIESAIQEFIGPTPPYDDITLLLAKRV